MALRVTRWVGATALACTAIAVVLLPPRAPRMRYGSGFYPRSWVLNRAQSQFDGVVNSLRLMRVRDSLSASASRATIAESNGLQVVADLGIPTRVTDPATVLIERAWEQLDAPQSGVPVMVAMLLDTSYTFEGLERSYLTRRRTTSYALPTDPSARSACISIIDFGPDLQADSSLHAGGVSRVRERALGACKYYAVFGMPGADIAQWLHRWEYVPIGSADWPTVRLEDQETRFSSLPPWRGLLFSSSITRHIWPLA